MVMAGTYMLHYSSDNHRLGSTQDFEFITKLTNSHQISNLLKGRFSPF